MASGLTPDCCTGVGESFAAHVMGREAQRDHGDGSGTVDEHSRECLGGLVERSITAETASTNSTTSPAS